MTEPHDCPAMRSILAELATGAAAGHDRAWALGQVAGCPTCQAELDELAKVADGLLMLAPPAEPPPEFETAVLTRLGVAGSRRVERWPRRLVDRYPRRRALAVAVTVTMLLIGSGGAAALVYRQGEQDRVLAEQYRQTLAVANGRYLNAARLTSTAGEQSGTVFLYQGSPSWLLVTATAAPTNGRYEILVRDRGGALRTVGYCQITNGSGTAGYQLDIPVAQIAEVQLRQDNEARLTATLPS
jgi:hypothetical protein